MTRFGARLQRGFGVAAVLALVTACGLQQLGGEQGMSVVLGGSGANGTQGGNGGTAGGSNAAGGANGSGTSGGVAGGQSSTGGGGTTGAGGSGTPAQQNNGLHGTIQVGYINVTGFSDLAAGVPVGNIQSDGNAQQQTQIIANWINAHGGIAGKQLVPDAQNYNAQQATAATEQTYEQGFKSRGDFAVVLAGQIHPQTRDDYKADDILALEGSNYGWSQSFIASHSPSEWAPSFPSYDETERALVKTLSARNWFNGDPLVGVVSWSDQTYQDVVNSILTPALKNAGIATVDNQQVDSTSIQSIEQGLQAALTNFQTTGVQHVLFVGSDPLAPFFITDAQGQHNSKGQNFIYGVTSWDSPDYYQWNSEANNGTMNGSIGIGFMPGEDVPDNDYAFPHAGMEAQCYQIYKQAGLTLPARVNSAWSSKQAISYCEQTLFLQAVAKKVSGPLTLAAWSAAAETMGSSMQLASNLYTSLGPDHTGGAAYREIDWTGSCSCYTYGSPNYAFQ